MERRRKYSFVARIALLLVATLAGGTLVANAQAPFGTLCQADFQNNWQAALPHSWERCGWFNQELDDTDVLAFYWNLHGARTFYSSCDGCGGIGADTVVLLYTNTHGSALSLTDARLAMWDQNTFAFSNTDNWRLGDESFGLSILANYACETLTNADSSASLINRWRNTFRGGLRMALGSHDKLYDGVTTNECGEDFANYLQAGWTIKWAWFDGNGDWSVDQDVKVLVTGTDSANCAARRDTMRWQTFHTFPRLRDSNVGWFCSWKIDNN